MIVREECRFVSKRKYKKQLDEREDMRIKLAILENDHNYLNRIVSVFSTKYADRLVIFSFTDLNMALDTLEEAKIDVLIADDSYDVDVSLLPKRCSFAYFVDSADINSIKNQKAICKFQKVDLIYKQILSIYSESSSSISGITENGGLTKVIGFVSASGGAGASTMAAACALHYASMGEKTLYLNLEKYGASDSFFTAEGQFDMSDIIYALKSKKSNISLKLESCIKQDSRGVYFYSSSKIALDMTELTGEDILQLLSILTVTGNYSYIILDMDFGLTADYMKIYNQLTSIVLVGDGSEISNTKTIRAYQAMQILEQNQDHSVLSKFHLLYNRFSDKTGKTISNIEMKNIGGSPKFENATSQQIVTQLSMMTVFDKIN